MTQTAEIFLRRALRIDLEIDRESRRVLRLGAVRSSGRYDDRGDDDRDEVTLARSGTAQRPLPPTVLTAELDPFVGDAERVLGHNLLHHDLPILRAEAPSLRILGLPVVDTLYLSALAFPERPYHRLVKDYRLVRESINDPVADARLATDLFRDAWASLADQERQTPGLTAFYAACFDENRLGDRDGLADLLRRIGSSAGGPSAAASVSDLVDGRACRFTVEQLVDELGTSPPPATAYVVAWLRVAGEDSVLPPWVRKRFPEIPRLLDRLRRGRSTGEPCPSGDACAYCAEGATPEDELERYFGFPAFRDEPRDADGGSLQRRVTVRGLARQSQLAVLATGAGKSICYQLPALVHYRRRGLLTIVISPLQALMKDQVDHLNRAVGAERAAALYGLLTPPERGRVLEGVRSGEIALLYVAPEQLRNRSFEKVIEVREIATWVYDEAHCLSKWGHDFRPDYLFAARFIRRLADAQDQEPPAIACFTATAKRDVVAEIVDHFRREMDLELELSTSRVERDELRFFVETVSPARKLPRIAELLAERFGIVESPGTGESPGSAVVYFSSRKGTVEASLFLQNQGFDARAFHAGLSPPEKRETLEAFTEGRLAVVCATNAFGMGIDKDDVRLVIHADVPGSLEAYLQEAGRAGRDRRESDCVLLFDEADVERRLKLTASSKLEKADLEQILRAVRRAVRKRPNGVAALTSGELLRDEDLDIDIRPDDWQADTLVRAAVAWLERAGFVERGHNRTWVFQGKLQVESLDDARRRIDALPWTRADRRRRLSILRDLIQAPDDGGLSVDDLAQHGDFQGDGADAGKQVIRDLQALVGAGLIREGLQLTAYVRPKGKGNSSAVLESVSRLERAMIAALQEEDPDAEAGTPVSLSLRRLNQRLLDRGESSHPEALRALLKSLSEDGKGLAGSHGSLDLRYLRRGFYSVRLRRDWEHLAELADRRRQVARVALDALLAKPGEGASGQVLVAFSLDEVVAAVERDLVLRQTLRDPLAAAERALLFLHEHRAIQLQHGLAVFRQAMTLELQDEKKGRRYTRGDYQPLAEHYEERTFQVHVMARYAEEALVRLRRGLELVHDYFEHGRDAFAAKWFHGREEELLRATGPGSYRRIVDDLGHPEQQAIVTAPVDRNLLVLAGPGSGKTRVVVHRCAYLLRVERVPARSILVVCFNRAASLELRRRLRALVGDDAVGVTVCTYHALALRILGRSFADGFDADALKRLVPEAADLLESDDTPDALPGMEADELREHLLAGFRHVLVDEYQDVGEDQYRLISAVVGRTRREGEQHLSLLAVGDDDQTIYGFTGANVRFIRQFQKDYGAGEGSVHHLVDCFRSTHHIVDAANHLVAHNRDRMKVEHPIRVDPARRHDPPGEPVRVLTVRSVEQQAAAVAEEIHALGDTGSVAVLARTRAVLEPVYALLRHQNPEADVTWLGAHALPPLSRVREIRDRLDRLHERRHQELTASQTFHELDLEESASDDPWTRVLRRILEEWREESHDLPVPGSAILEFVYEALAEQRREPAQGSGPVLATVHKAKGLEFDRVFLIDGGWRPENDEARREEERRLYYVGMTRARKHLRLFTGIDGPNPHAELFPGEAPFLERATPEPTVPPRAVWGRSRKLIGLENIFLSWAGRRNPPTHEHIAAVATGDPVRLTAHGKRVLVTDLDHRPLAALSQSGTDTWRPLLPHIESARIHAWIERRAKDSDPEHRHNLRVDRWQVPILEVVLRPG